MLIDSHCHLDYLAEREPLDEILARARAAGVDAMLTISTRLASFPQVLDIAETDANIWCSVGVHPHEAQAEQNVDVARLIALAAHPKVIGIGETGLDYHYMNSPKDVQKALFRTHIRAARDSGLPLIVHAREADADIGDILEMEMGKGAFCGVMHCFSSSPELAWRCLEMGFYISISGIVTFKNAGELRELVARLPLERILLETDAPYLAPVPRRGRMNEPAFLPHTAACIATVKNIETQDVKRISSDNFKALFGVPDGPGRGLK